MPKKILIIDDEELIIRSLAKLLDKNGFEVFVAKKGDDALVFVEDCDYDFIISDIRMPGINGIEVIKSIFDVCVSAKRKKPKVIFITGFADEKLEKEAKKLNCAAYLYKPFDSHQLLEVLRRSIES